MYRAGGPKQVIRSKNCLQQIVGLLNNFVAETVEFFWQKQVVEVCKFLKWWKFADSG